MPAARLSTLDTLAEIGYLALRGEESPIIHADDEHPAPEDYERPRLADHARVRALLLDAPASSRSGDLIGAKWVRLITWPDRVPGLRTWAGQATLPRIIAAHQKRLRADETPDLFAVRGKYKGNEGPSGLDAGCCPDALDVGFSLAESGVDIVCRPAVELLAIVGLECVPLVSYSPRDCGFLHGGRAYRFGVEPRDGGYYHRWAETMTATEIA